MVIPSNDAFIANADPLTFQLFDAGGIFTAVNRLVAGAMVRDAGTEVNDEIPANTAFLGQSVPNTGTSENGVVMAHAGFLPGGNILGSPQFANANFLASGYNIAQISIAAVPEPATGGLLAAGLAALLALTRRR